ncbi:DUF4352 domain-containing protein [Neobacillus sp. NPDC058068]|uniref:DUF4352 domain-containing protein n=1 Tax=Neobacillus sp. NPDC058068 TaxID=3346325 RepID=UPI0036DF1072
MTRKALLVLVLGILSILLAACGSENKPAKKVEAPATSKENAEKEEGTGLEALKGKDLESMSAEDWKKVNLSKKQFKEFLKNMTAPDEKTGEITINKATMKDDRIIEITLNNSDGDNLTNAMIAPIMDAIVREVYKHSAYFKKDEPTLVFFDLTGFKIMENNKPIDFDSKGASSSGKDLGKFKIGDKVDVAGTVITITGAKYTDERNQFQDPQPAKVLTFDITVQNATQEELFFGASDFEVYDADGTKMESYPIDDLTETLQPGKNASGRGAFGVSGKGPYEIYYKDFATDTKAMWTLDLK